MSGRERVEFMRKLSEAAHEIAPRELGLLLDRGWRESGTATWLIAVAGRTEFRERLGELLLAGKWPYAGQAYCVALPPSAPLPTPTSWLLTSTRARSYGFRGAGGRPTLPCCPGGRSGENRHRRARWHGAQPGALARRLFVRHRRRDQSDTAAGREAQPGVGLGRAP
ncbi:DUF6000 family protein [Streptomyces coeruleorubidus]|uniref:DUF6000 family protein n=1 Tax=Streptomyces coeruleorubidus TaxID=116188 RepID=UPI00340573B8